MFLEETNTVFETCDKLQGMERTLMMWATYAKANREDKDPGSGLMLLQDWIHNVRRGKIAYNLFPKFNMVSDLSQKETDTHDETNAQAETNAQEILFWNC